MAKQPKPEKRDKLPLHKFIATGGKPENFPRNPALSSKTVPGLKDKK